MSSVLLVFPFFVFMWIFLLLRLLCTLYATPGKQFNQNRYASQRVRVHFDRANPSNESDPPNSNIYTITDAHMRNAPAYNNDIILIESARDESRPVPASVVKDDSNLPTYDEVIAAGIPIEPANADNTMPPAPPYSAIDPHKARVDVPRP